MVVVLAACGGGASGTDAPVAIDAALDATEDDAAVVDAAPDAMIPDAAPDAMGPDAMGPDATGPDATIPDAMGPDAMGPDAMIPDAGVLDAASPDAGELPPLGAGLATLSGAATSGYVDGARGVARFDNPVNIAALADGGVVVADFYNSRLRRVDADGTTSTLVTTPVGFLRPFGLARAGTTLWVQTDRNSTAASGGALWRVDLTVPSITLEYDNLGVYRGVAVLSDGRLVLSNHVRHVVSIYDPTTDTLTPLAGALDQPGNVDATGADARFMLPTDVAVLPGDVIVVADLGNGAIRRVTLDGVVTTYATGLTSPQGLAVAPDGTLYITEPDSGTIRHHDGATLTLVAGTGTPGYADDPDPLAGQLHGLEGLDVSTDGQYLFVANGSRGEDLPYHFVRRVSLD